MKRRMKTEPATATEYRRKALLRFGQCALIALIAAGCAVSVLLSSSSYPVRSDDDTSQEEAEDDITYVINGEGDNGGYSAVMYNDSNGLPTSAENAVLITREGSVWIGGYSGLVRYDGGTFTRIEGNSNVASILSLMEDSQGRIWVGTNDSGAAVMIDWQWHIFNKKDGMKSLSVRDITEDSNGNVYLATTEGLYWVDKDLELHEVASPKIEGQYIRSIKTGKGDTIYGVILEKAVFTVKDGELTGYYDMENQLFLGKVRAVYPDPADPNLVYVGTEKNEVYFGVLSDNGFMSMETISTGDINYVNSIDSVGDLVWICADNGFGYIKEYKFYPVKNTPMRESVERITSDYLGNLWLTSSKQGVMKIVPNQFTDIFWEYGLSDEVVNTTCMYNDMLFIGTKNGGIKVLYKDSVLSNVPVTKMNLNGIVSSRNYNLVAMLADCRVRDIVADSQGNLWICTFSDAYGLIKYNDGYLTCYTKSAGLPSNRIRAITELGDDRYAVCCSDGLAIMEDGKVTRVYNEASGIENTEILTCTEFNGELVIGTDGGGIYRISGDSVIHIGTDDGLSSDVILRLKKDKTRPILWVVTSNSLGYITEDFQIKTLDGFPYYNNFDLYENSRDEMWVVSSNGLYVANVDALLSGGEIPTIYYGSDNGLQTMPNANTYSWLTDDGDLYLAGMTGVSKVNIDKKSDDVGNIKLSVPYLIADGQYIIPDYRGNFTIPADTRKVTIELSIYNYTLINPDVSYQLEGNDKTAFSVKRSNLDPIDYTNLKGGVYTFRVIVDDPRGMSEKEYSMTITKEKTFLEQTWARLLLVVFFLALVLIAVKIYIEYRTRKYIKKENEQRILIREMVEAFAKIIDMKDRYTNGHSTRVAQFTALLTRELGYDEDTVEKNYNIALLHDIGKIGIPPEVLNKPGKLEPDEYEVIKSHSPLGFDALKDISIMPELAIGAGAHHERPDGKGYPKGLKGNEIPRVAQIIAVADTFDAMYSDRPYRKHMDFNKVVGIMKDAAGTQLTEDVIEAFLRLVDKGEIRGHLDEDQDTPEDKK